MSGTGNQYSIYIYDQTTGLAAALLRLAGHVLIEQHDEWDGADRRYFSEHSMTHLNTTEETEEEVAIPELTAA